MNFPMDDRRVLAEIERRLTREDPGLASLMAIRNEPIPGDQEDAGAGVRHDVGGHHGRRRKLAVAFAVVAILGLLLTAVLSERPAAYEDRGRLNGPAPAVSVQSRRRGHRPRTAPGQRCAGRGTPTVKLPRGERHARM
ncbi:DUF3040 domain-containing protein [Streptomyces sp. NPDC046685]|uniref:DUF3040 domain-containing protein n=1 Tax=Streptomyces sp. NPDC046685 TaxID=3157202 RepID=UPI0033EF7B9A